jgi:phloretin hydrolase
MERIEEPHLNYIPERRPLSQGEEAKPYAKYYYRPLKCPKPALLKFLEKPIDPSEALPISQINRLLSDDHGSADIGYCVMPDGSGYLASKLFLEGCTAEMLDWWGYWHAEENLRYAIWYYPSHMECSLLEKGAGWASTKMSRKIGGGGGFGNLCGMVEDVGLGPDRIRLRFLSPEDFGLDAKRLDPDVFMNVSGGCGRSCPADAPEGTPTMPATVLHLGKRVPGGVEMISHFWIGWSMNGGKPSLELPPQFRIPEIVPLFMLNHCIREFTNLGSILPLVFAEEHGKS